MAQLLDLFPFNFYLSLERARKTTSVVKRTKIFAFFIKEFESLIPAS